MKKFALADLSTADMAFHAFGTSLGELFSNAALAIFSIITDAKAKPEVERKVEISAADLESLMVDWLNELIFLFDIEHIIFSRFDVKVEENDGYKLVGSAFGEPVKPKHKFKAYVKAATYHMLEIKKERGKWVAQVVVDL